MISAGMISLPYLIDKRNYLLGQCFGDAFACLYASIASYMRFDPPSLACATMKFMIWGRCLFVSIHFKEQGIGVVCY